jgi:Tfp pilus assembly protein PilN
MSEKLERELDAAQAELQKLLDERQSLSAQLAQASDAEVVNVKALIELQRRADEIPKHIYAATVRALRARITILERRLVSEQETAQLEIAAASEVYERLKALEATYTQAVILRDNVRTQVTITRSDLSVAKRELEREIFENTKPHAPLVRSRIHAA